MVSLGLRVSESAPRLDRRRVTVGLIVALTLSLGGQLQRFLHDYRSLSHPDNNSVPSDFLPYYVGAKTASDAGDHRLYYPSDKSFLMITGGHVAKDTPWSQTAKAAGLSETMAFIYPPFAALLLRPLAHFNWQFSLFIWRLALTLMVLLSLYLTLILTEVNRLLLIFVLMMSGIFSFFPFTETLFQGQIDPVILLSWVAGVYLLKKERPISSAFSFAVGTLVKVSPVIVVGVFLLRRQWKWLFSFAGWCLLLLAVSIWRLGWENHVLWAIRVFPALSQGVPYFANKSLSALIYELYLGRVPLELDFSIPVVLSRLVSLLNLGIFGGTLYYFWRRNRSATGLVYELVAMAVVAIVIAPVAWRHHYLLTLLPLIFLWLRSKDAWRDWLVLAIFTLSTGLVFLDYVVVSIRNPLIDILATAVQPMTTLLFLWFVLDNYPVEPRTLPEVATPDGGLQGSSA